jgi:hypothetical protein
VLGLEHQFLLPGMQKEAVNRFGDIVIPDKSVSNPLTNGNYAK